MTDINPFDQFDTPQNSPAPSSANPFDKFDGYGAIYGGPTGVPRIDIAPPKNQPTGLVTQGLSGVMEGIQNLPSTIPRMAVIVGQGIDYLTGDKEAAEHDAQAAALAASIQKNMPSITNYLPQPANPAEQAMRTGGNFLAGAAASPGGASRFITQGVLPAVTSEAAGQVFQGTPYEAPARVGGAVIGGVRGGVPEGAVAPTLEKAATPTTQELFAAAKGPGGYRGAETGPIFQPEQMEQLVSDTKSSMEEGGSADYLAPKTFRAIEDLTKENSVEGAQKVRVKLNTIGEKGDKFEVHAVTMAKQAVDDFLERNAPEQAAVLKEANANMAAGFRSKKLDTAFDVAGFRKGRAGYGGNAVNAVRQVLSPIVEKAIKGKTQGFSPEEIDAMRKIVEGTPVTNTLRLGSMFAPEKGAVNLGVGMEIGHRLLGMKGIPVIAVLGRAANKLAERMTEAQINRLSELVRQRSPAYQKAVEAAANRYADAMDSFRGNPTQASFIRFVVASRNLSNGFRKDGIGLSSGDLMHQFNATVPSGAEQQQSQ